MNGPTVYGGGESEYCQLEPGRGAGGWLDIQMWNSGVRSR